MAVCAVNFRRNARPSVRGRSFVFVSSFNTVVVVSKNRYPGLEIGAPDSIIAELICIIKVMLSFSTQCEVTFLPVYYPSEQERKDPILYANQVRQLMVDALIAAESAPQNE